MSQSPPPPSKQLFRLAGALQGFVLLAAAVAYFLGARYIEFTLRRSVEHAAAISLEQWAQHLKLLAPSPVQSPSPEGAHLLPIPALTETRLMPPQKAPARQGQPLPGLQLPLFVSWPQGFAFGLVGMAQVRALPSCQSCHRAFVPGELVGELHFRVETRFLTELLRARKLNLAGLVVVVSALASAGLWVLAGLASRRQRRAEQAIQEAQQALAASEARYRTLVEHSLVGVYLIQGDRFLYCNPTMARMFGYSREEVVEQKRVEELVAPEDRQLVAENLRKRFAGEVQALRYRFTALKKDGTRFPVEVFGARTLLPSGPAVLGMIVDNTAVEQAEKLVQTAYDAVVSLSGEGMFPQAATSLAALLQVPVVFVSERADDQLLILGSHGLGTGEKLPLAGTPCQQVMVEKRPLEIPAGFAASYGGPPFVAFSPESYLGFPLLDSRGQALGVLALLDARPRTYGELERRVLEIYAVRLGRELEQRQLRRQQQELEKKLLASEKLAALGELAGGVAHDFNNVLAGILAEAEVLAREVSPQHQKLVEHIQQLAQRGGEVVRRILAFARPQLPRWEVVAVDQLVEEAVALAQRSFGPHIAVQREVAKGLYVLGDAGNLQQVLLNLLTNARDAMPQGGRLWVRAFPRESQVVLEVEDEGEGIPPELLPRVMEPFFTTKGRGQGTGLGLTTAFRTVEAHGGHLTLTSQRGVGTKVTVTLPAAGTRAPEAAAKPAPLAPLAGARVLLVDDEPAILSSLSQLLAGEGLQVAAFASAEEAWSWVQDQEVDAAVLDVLLPGMSGVQLAILLAARHPQVALVLSSGHGPTSLPPELAQHRKLALLQKPYPVKALLQLLQELLAKA